MNDLERYFDLLVLSAARVFDANEEKGSPLGDFSDVNALRVALNYFTKADGYRRAMQRLADPPATGDWTAE